MSSSCGYRQNFDHTRVRSRELHILAVRDRQGDIIPASQVLTQPDNFIWIAIGIPVCQGRLAYREPDGG